MSRYATYALPIIEKDSFLKQALTSCIILTLHPCLLPYNLLSINFRRLATISNFFFHDQAIPFLYFFYRYIYRPFSLDK